MARDRAGADDGTFVYGSLAFKPRRTRFVDTRWDTVHAMEALVGVEPCLK